MAGIGWIGIALGISGVLYNHWLDLLHDTRARGPAPHERFACYTFLGNVFIADWVPW
jgi:hypothetical protein